ncbi:MAG: polysaccharide deacetylase family protein [Candidatus Acidiferrales bacterium]
MNQAIATRLLCRSGLRALLGRAMEWSGLLVLNYHRVGNGKESPFDRGLWSAGTEAFTDQIRFCKSQLDLITPDDIPHVLARGRGRHALITFDDGYRDNYEIAFPILKRESVPATFFIATGFVDAPQVPWWDEIAWMVRTSRLDRVEFPGWVPAPVSFDEPEREGAVRTFLRAYKMMPAESTSRYLDALAESTGSGRCGEDVGNNFWMNWDMLREMKSSGMTVAGHTVTHPILACAPIKRQREEILGCGTRLVEEMREPMRYFSYPVGGPNSFNSVTHDCLREAGVQYAFSYYGGFRRFGDWNDFDVRRVAVEPGMTDDWFRSIVTLPQFFA